MASKNLLISKLLESVKSVLPISLIVAVLCLLFVPVDNGLFIAFIIGTILIIVGMALFNIGSEISMIHIGNQIGAKITKTKKILLILFVALVIGIMITFAEPDLQVLATNTPNINSLVLIVAVSVGVGIFLSVGMLRILVGIPIKWLLLGFYAIVFLLLSLSDDEFIPVAFDSGGVTTGPMTVPFIMSLGAGVASIRSDDKAKEDGFGLLALCSIGPIVAVLILGFLFPPESGSSSVTNLLVFKNSMEVGVGYLASIPKYLKEISLALLPIVTFFLLFQVLFLKMEKKQFLRILIGLCYSFIGLVMFMVGVNVGFSSLGYVLGVTLVENDYVWLIVPVAMLMGWFIIKAEPAVHVLNKQVSAISAGAIAEKTIGFALSIAISIAMGIALLRVLTGVSLLWFVIPGYAIALLLSFIVPPLFTSIAFDSGGVASGSMTATFMLPFALGVCNRFGGNILTDAFGLIAIVAMMPLITVQIMGALTMLKSKRAVAINELFVDYGKEEVIELWEAD